MRAQEPVEAVPPAIPAPRVRKGLGAEVARIERDQLARVRREVEDRIGESDKAVTELLLDFERRLVELERRAVLKPQKPQLVASGGADG